LSFVAGRFDEAKDHRILQKLANRHLMPVTDDKTVVREYFNATGFDRWQRIYGDGEVNKVQLDIRKGHQKTVDTLMGWFEADGNLNGLTCCDAGCGVGSLSIPLAEAGAKVYASDISAKMVAEAERRAQMVLAADRLPTFEVKDLEELAGKVSHRDLSGCADSLSPR
jgi:magnesium-protoporphyrin O-methyltransferase